MSLLSFWYVAVRLFEFMTVLIKTCLHLYILFNLWYYGMNLGSTFISRFQLTFLTQTKQDFLMFAMLQDDTIIFHCWIQEIFHPNPLNANSTKWSNTLKQFVCNSRRIVSVCLIILWAWHLKGWNIFERVSLAYLELLHLNKATENWSSVV